MCVAILGRAMAAAITMQILCWISIALISHGSSLNVNRLSSRWARSDDDSDGWQASNGPYNPGPYPISRPAAVTEVVPTALTASTASTFRKADEGLPILTAASAEGFYEVLVGMKSPISETMGVGSNFSPTGSPDVIIGRVMSSTGGIESTTTASGIGYSHPPQPIVPVTTVIEEDKRKAENEDTKAEERSEIRDALEMESRSTSADSLIKKNDYTLPPGSFYLPAVSRKDHQYYSDSEKAIYIPLRRKDPLIQSFPVTTRVVLVNQNQPVTPVVFSPPPAVYHISKEGDEEEVEETEEQETRSSTEEEEEEEEEDNEEDSNIHPQHKPTIQPTTPVQSHSSALDLVMTLYPNLPKLIPPSYFNSQTIKNFLKLNNNRPPNGGGEIGSTSVIHEAKVVTPPQGYLPQLFPKPILKPAIVKGNALLTQFKSPNKVNFGGTVSSSSYPLDQTRHQSTKPTAGPSKTTIQFVPFTPEDISPLNFLLPPVSSATERVTVADQPDTRSNYIAGVIPTSNVDLIADSNVHITQRDPLKIVPAPKLDFAWNQFQPLPSEISHQPSAASDLTLLSVLANNNQQQQQHHEQQQQQHHEQPQQQQHHEQQQQKEQVHQQDERKSVSDFHQSFFVPSETAEVVVRSKMATSGSDSGNDARIRPPGESADIITGYFDGQPVLSTTIIPPTEVLKEIQTTTTIRRTTVSPIPVEEIATTTAPSRDDEIARTTIPSIPELQGNFQPSFGKFPYSSGPPQDQSHQPELVSDVPLVSPSPTIRVFKDQEDHHIFLVPHGLPNLADDQHVAGSQIHETSVYEENIPRVRPIKPQSAAQEGEGKSSAPYYKTGKMSPKGAMYTVTQGHSKVKFFGYNALHNGELKPIDGKYLASLLHKHEQQQQHEPDWKFRSYLPIRSPGGGSNSAFKVVPKKSIPIANGRKPAIRPVFFAKRPGNPDVIASSSKSSQGSSSNAPWYPSIVVSEPFEYHAHLQKMAEDQGRLPINKPITY